MEDILVKQFYALVEEMKKNVDPSANQVITPETIFQPAIKNNRKIFKEFLDTLALEGSGVDGKENLLEFYENFKAGKSSLILSEHKSNFDVPVFFAVMYRQDDIFKKIFEEIVFVAGRRLNEEEIFVKLMAEQYNRVIVATKSELDGASKEEIEQAMMINLATQKYIRSNRTNHIFLVYPTGTRSKPWDRSTYQGIREVFNYVKLFDQVIFMSINGNCMVPRKAAMSKEPPRKDNIRLIFSKPIKSKDWIKEQKAEWEKQGKKGDFKQYAIDRVMDNIYGQKGIMPWDEK